MTDAAKSHKVALGLGANLGQPRKTFEQACELLANGGLSAVQRASCYRTEPVGCHPGTPLFCNSAVTGLWGGSPRQLLELTQSIEVQLGRPRQHDSQGSRSIDIDLLLYDGTSLNSPDLCLPHPRMCERLFVLQPLAEIAADWPIPPGGKTVAGQLQDLLRKTGCPPVCQSVLQTIGNTPLVELSRLREQTGFSGRILLKLEYLNPGFSKKDRIALQMLEEAEASGELQPGQTVVELTSGNTGTGLAIVCAVKKHPFIAVMSRGNSPERARMMAALGAEVILVEQRPESQPGQVSGGDLEKVEEMTRKIVLERGAFRADQFKLPGNFNAHFLHTGEELWQQSGGSIEVFCDFIGTGGSFAGIQAALLKHNPEVQCYLVEPASCAVYAGLPQVNPSHRIQGGGYSMRDLRYFQPEKISGFVQVTDQEAMQTARQLAREEGIFAGFSTGANVAAALKLLQGAGRGRTIAALACDSGLKYLSTDLWPAGGTGTGGSPLT